MNEEEVRTLLVRVQPPPSQVDLATVQREGQRGVRRRRYAIASVIVATALAALAVPATIGALRAEPHRISIAHPSASTTLTSPVPAHATCPITPLPMPPDTELDIMTAVDPTGQYIAGTAGSGGRSVAILWTNRVPRLLAGPEGVGRVVVNAHGVVAGNATAPQDYVFRYQNGHSTPLRVPSGYVLERTANFPKINSAGDIVALVSNGQWVSAAIWPAGTQTPRLVPLTPASQEITAFGDDGTMLGWSNERKAYLWDHTGRGHLLEMPAGVSATPSGIRDSWVTGWLMRGDGTSPGPAPSPVLWDPRTGKLVTDSGTVTKYARWFAEFAYSKYLHRSNYVVFDDHGQEVPLATPPGLVRDAAGVTDAKLVVGWLSNGGGLTGGTPVTWQC